MQKWKMLLLLSCIICTTILHAQTLDSTLAIYRAGFQQEKLHLHFDKTVYNKGETIWFKAYILAGENLSDYSRNFYVDWYNDLGQLIKHTVHPIFESSVRAQFDVPANYTGEVLHLKAYTRWMLNFDSAFVYSKDIQITQSGKNTPQKIMPAIASLRFFPEGGDLVNGIESNIAFLAANQSGKPVAIRGAIFNSAHQLVDSILSVHDGMGVFSLIPSANEKYTCNWIDEYGINHTNTLPVAKNSGIVIESKLVDGKAKYAVKRNADAGDNFKSIHVIASMNQQLIYKAAINMRNKLAASGEIPTEDLQTGVLQITLFDANWIPVSERVLFINNQRHQFFPEVHLINKRFTKKGKNSIELFVPDSVLSNLSISITDANLFQDSSTNIFSDFLLAGDVKGYIHQPAYYFSDKGAAAEEQLDLVMLTHGWRRYKWEDIAAGKLPQLTYPVDSDYVQIKGRLISGTQTSFKPNQAVSIIMQAKDSSKQYFVLPLNTDGSFKQRGIIFFDTAKVFYQLNGIKNARESITANFQYGLPLLPYPNLIRVTNKTVADSAQLNENNFFYSNVSKTKKMLDSVVILKEVVVDSKMKSTTDVLDEKYTTGLFTNKNGYAFDVMNDDRSHGQVDIFHYLQNMIPGLTMSLPVLGQNGAEDANSNNVPGLNWRDGTPDIFLNEMPSDAGVIQGIQMSDVAYIKVFRPPFMAASGSGASGAIAVYTKKGGDLNTDRIKGLNSAILSGYTTYKEFYQPDYTISQSKYPDLRATLYWNPYVLTDKKNKTFKLDFFNNDITQKFRIVIEGVNAAGKMARIEKLVE